MRKFLAVQLSLAMVLLAACADSVGTPTEPGAPVSSQAQSADVQEANLTPGRVLARFEGGVASGGVLASYGATLEGELVPGIQMLNVPVGQEQAIATAMSANPTVEFAEPDYFYQLDVPCETGSCDAPSDFYFGYKWDLHNDGTITTSTGVDIGFTGAVDADMDWLEAYDAIRNAPGSISGTARIGIIDSGVRADHEDLTGKVVAGYDYYSGDADPSDENGHGTHVAGIAAAHGNNGVGVAGVAWMPEVELVVARVCSPTGSCPWSALASGIYFAVDNGSHSLNISIGGSFGSSTVQTALQYARTNDVLPFCSAGNSNGSVSFPAAYPECVAVSSTDWSDNKASYSNFGPQIELSAPGGDFEAGNSLILASYYTSTSAYAYLAGTSMASPQAAGLAGLLHAMGVTDDDAKLALMKSSSDDLGSPGQDNIYGAGRINIYNAVADLLGPSNDPPTASFTQSCPALGCSFTDTSTDTDGTIVSWAWVFGDGGTSTLQNPTHTYGAGGTYTVSLTVTDDDGATDTFSTSLTVSAPNEAPTAAFTEVCTDLSCQFTDGSTDSDGTIASWAWTFGDGGTSTAQNPTHVYAAAGTYTVSLTVLDDDGAPGTTSHEVTVAAGNQAPTAAFTEVCTDLTCQFTDGSTDTDGTIASWAWTFGDGGSSTAQNPSYTYASAGTYTVSLTVMDDDGAPATFSKSVTVTEPGPDPVVSFTYECTGLVCQFTDTSTYPSELLRWYQFGDGTQAFEADPSHTYPAPGTYSVLLRIFLGGGNLVNYTEDIVVGESNQAPTASFTEVCSDLSCQFTDASSDSDGTIASWAWTFGDGGTSSVQNPTHTYASGGPYTVSLTVTDDDGATDTFSKTVTVVEPNQAPSAAFTEICTDLDCQFTDTSSDSDGSIASWAWTFGDGGSSTTQSPSHSYAAGGTYTVSLMVTDNDGATDTFSKSVTVVGPNQAPTAAFTEVCTDLACQFTDGSSDSDGSIASWAWTFGDGGTSSTQNPSHTYGAAGTYTVSLTVMDDDGAPGTTSHEVTVVAPNQAPTAAFTEVCTDLTCQFTDGSSDSDGSIASWAWMFGDGGTSSTQNPSHTYAAAGTYTVSLTVMDDDGAPGTTSHEVTVVAPNQAPTAAFTEACTDLACQFTDGSTDSDGSIASWAWTFGDGGSSTAQNPSHTYASAGTYTVSLTVTDDDGAPATFSKSVTVTEPGPGPVVSFTYECTGLGCQFTDTSTYPSELLRWYQFGDGTQAFEADPSHTYPAPGTYSVLLRIFLGGGNLVSYTEDIVVGESNEAPTASFTEVCSDLSCQFTDASSDSDGTIASWAWTFGDGGTSSVQNPTHTYASGGPYTVSLTVTDDDGATDTFSKTVTVVEPNQAPSAAFTEICTDLDCQFTDTSSDSDGSIASWAWTFGDGGSSTTQSPSHSYAAGGTYTVSLMVTDNDGATDTFSKSVTVVAPNQAPTAAFTEVCTDLACQFTDGSSDSDGSIASWAWTFGDGGTSSTQNPSHTYGAAGTYTVSLTVTDDDGAPSTFSKSVTVTEPSGPEVSFTYTCTGLTCSFTDTSTYPPGLRWWKFGDGSQVFVSDPTHTYAEPGTYPVTLSLFLGGGNLVSVTVDVTVPPAE